MRTFLMIWLLGCGIIAVVVADGGGGLTYGFQTSNYPFLKENYDIINNNLGLITFGGYGYDVNSRGQIEGGFGTAFLDPVNASGIAGGFAGIIAGYRFLRYPITLSVVSWTGFGGIYAGTAVSEVGHKGFFCIMEEVTLELGIPLLKWFMPVAFAGYQVAGNVVPGQFFQTFLSYTPIMGMRIAWGDFY